VPEAVDVDHPDCRGAPDIKEGRSRAGSRRRPETACAPEKKGEAVPEAVGVDHPDCRGAPDIKEGRSRAGSRRRGSSGLSRRA